MNDVVKYPTFDDLFDVPAGEVITAKEYGPIKGLILRGSFSLCAYIGIPEWHPLARYNYDDIPLQVHGGLTFGAKGDGETRPSKFYWYGWDYAHAFDKCLYEYSFDHHPIAEEHGWTVAEVEKELEDAIKQFKWLFYVGWIAFVIRGYILRFLSK